MMKKRKNTVVKTVIRQFKGQSITSFPYIGKIGNVIGDDGTMQRLEFEGCEDLIHGNRVWFYYNELDGVK